MASRPNSWPLAKLELLPHILSSLAERYPDVIYAEYFSDPVNIADGYRKVTYRELANAVHEMAWWIEENVGKPKKDDGSETIIFFGGDDLRYGIMVFASIMVGYKTLIASPRYGADAIANLIAQVHGQIMLSCKPAPPICQEVLSIRPMKTYEIPSQEALFQSSPRPYQYIKTFAKNRHEPLVSLHTSGTTGSPKPILYTHDWAASHMHSFRLAIPEAFNESSLTFMGPRKRLMFLFAPYYASGVFSQALFGPSTGATMIYPPPALTTEAQMKGMLAALEFLGDEEDRKVDWLLLPPPQTEYLGSNAEFLDKVSPKVPLAGFSGDGISEEVGTAISQKMGLWSIIGSTEIGIMPQIISRNILSKTKNMNETLQNRQEEQDVRDFWRYMHFHPEMNIRFEPVSMSDEGPVYESIMVRNADSGWVQPIFKIFEDVKERNLGDLFVRHPTKPDMWKHYGRADELLTFYSGEKFHPTVTERRIQEQPGVKEVMMVGTKRPVAALILRLSNGGNLDDVFRSVEEVNMTSPVYAKVAKDMILVVDKPFYRTDKGSLQKKRMLELYAKELDDLYKKVASMP